MEPIRVGLLGLGVVGGGTFKVLARNAEEIARRAGRHIVVTKVSARNLDKARLRVGEAAEVVADAFDIVRAPDIDVVVELIGGDTLARELVIEAIRQGKHVVTANKALLAKHRSEEHTSELQSRENIVCRLLLEKKKRCMSSRT